MVRQRIIQIIPAQDWYVAFEVDGKIYTEPLACWALYEEESSGNTWVDGVGADNEGCEESLSELSDFAGFFYAPAGVEAYLEKQRLQEEKQERYDRYAKLKPAEK